MRDSGTSWTKVDDLDRPAAPKSGARPAGVQHSGFASSHPETPHFYQGGIFRDEQKPSPMRGAGAKSNSDLMLSASRSAEVLASTRKSREHEKNGS